MHIRFLVRLPGVVCVACLLAALAGCKLAGKATTKPVAVTVRPPSLYTRLGGEKAIQLIVNNFVARAAADPKVNFMRKGTGRQWAATPENVEKLKVHLTQFIMGATGGPAEYKGQDMHSVHQGMQISGAEFDALADDLKAAMEGLNVFPGEQQELMRIVDGTRSAIVER